MTIPIDKILLKLKRHYGEHHFDKSNKNDAFRTLVSCILSLRTKDEVTFKASDRLFKIINKPKDLAAIEEKKLSKIIYPVGFYRTKARDLIKIGQKLTQEYNGRVPDGIDELLKFKGVGRKTANLVVSLGHGKDAICVDTHVHRICNRFGYLRTRNPFETEMTLRKKLPKRFWKTINYVLVLHGQQICKPISPICSICPVEKWCLKRGVTTVR